MDSYIVILEQPSFVTAVIFDFQIVEIEGQLWFFIHALFIVWFAVHDVVVQTVSDIDIRIVVEINLGQLTIIIKYIRSIAANINSTFLLL